MQNVYLATASSSATAYLSLTEFRGCLRHHSQVVIAAGLIRRFEAFEIEVAMVLCGSTFMERGTENHAGEVQHRCFGQVADVLA